MPSQRINRISGDVHRELCDIIRTVKDPRVNELVSIIRVEVSGDLSYASVYVSSYGDESDLKTAVEGLTSASGYIKKMLASRLHIRKIPQLKFIADTSISRGAEISRILNSLDIPEDEAEDK